MNCTIKVIIIMVVIAAIVFGFMYFKSKFTKKKSSSSPSGSSSGAGAVSPTAVPCASGACPQPEPVANLGATAVKVSVKPDPDGKINTKTKKLIGSEEIVDPDGETVIVREWFDNGHLRSVGTNVLPGPFGYDHIITYKVSADRVSNEISVRIGCGMGTITK